MIIWDWGQFSTTATIELPKSTEYTEVEPSALHTFELPIGALPMKKDKRDSNFTLLPVDLLSFLSLTEIHPFDIEKIPGPFDPYAMNLYRHPVVHLTSRPALDNARYSQFQHCHTSIAINNRLRTDEQLYTLGMFTMFAQLSAQAQANGVLQGTNLDQPLVTQCIVSNGHMISFMMYQLNTLNMLTDKGVWNRCWYTPVMEMFERNNEASYGQIYEEALPKDILDGFDEQLPKYFHAFIGNEPV